MKNITSEYERLKRKNNDKHYLFKNGNFYIFIGEDCDYICKYAVLKKTNFSKKYQKCGFPISALDSYLNVFKYLNLNVEVIEEVINPIEDLRKININNIKLQEAKELLERIKNYNE